MKSSIISSLIFEETRTNLDINRSKRRILLRDGLQINRERIESRWRRSATPLNYSIPIRSKNWLSRGEIRLKKCRRKKLEARGAIEENSSGKVGHPPQESARQCTQAPLVNYQRVEQYYTRVHRRAYGEGEVVFTVTCKLSTDRSPLWFSRNVQAFFFSGYV